MTPTPGSRPPTTSPTSASRTSRPFGLFHPSPWSTPPFTTRDLGDEVEVTQVLRNPSPAIAFFVEVTVLDRATGLPILPILWDDNDRTLFPGESATWTARVRADRVRGRALAVTVTGWNLVP